MKNLFRKYYTDLFLGKRLFIAIGVCVTLFLFSFFMPFLGDLPYILFGILMVLVLLDIFLLYRNDRGVFLRRDVPERLSNGDDNELKIYLENFYPFQISVGIIDEIPFQFQKRDLWFTANLSSREQKIITYTLRPTKRGEYHFGLTRLYVQSPLALISRRFNIGADKIVPVYPSFLKLRQYELMAVSNRLTDIGIKKMRRIGHSMEFDQVKNYVAGDDYRTVNWKATARKGDLMVNSFTDEKAQHIYCIIDKSRAMKMPFEGLSLLDYAINASLILSSVALVKQDKAGLITIAEKTGSLVPADRRPTQLNKIMEVLYKEKTRYLETDMEALYISVRAVLKQRSLVVFFTNFESMSALERQLPFLKRIAKFHLLLVVFFENTTLKSLSEEPAQDIEGIYIKTIAEKFAFEKKLMVKELTKHGILSLLTPPQKLTVNVVNRYLAIKAKQQI
ncbi:DUF58 domain-containing protein [Pedobacter sp. LMG 31464]|uniref:DUF58 domain-containing protein n=1 Tax=Pedobacter planticolens TaxID=2679964 RepID=A0A923E1C3_9SPHI|nr:DUF58 domain-containing protein [Pedobacter planticolens]MBB2146588.1 DUF58 domain-containing protein [Pedobacter planticolens]